MTAASFPGTVVFDLDGTLVDSAPDLTCALNAVLRAHGQPEVAEAPVRHMVGRGAIALLERGFAEAGVRLDEARKQSLLKEFLVHYEAHIAVRSRPFEGVVEVLEHLSEAGIRLGVCTNKRERMSHLLLEALDLKRYFPVILGADSLDVRKPHPRHLLETIGRLGGAPEDAVMVGDSITDVDTARAAEVPVTVVSFGYSDIPAASLGGDRLIHHYRDALEAFAAIKAARL